MSKIFLFFSLSVILSLAGCKAARPKADYLISGLKMYTSYTEALSVAQQQKKSLFVCFDNQSSNHSNEWDSVLSDSTITRYRRSMVSVALYLDDRQTASDGETWGNKHLKLLEQFNPLKPFPSVIVLTQDGLPRMPLIPITNVTGSPNETLIMLLQNMKD